MAERNPDQIVAVAPQLRISRIPSPVLWGDADAAFERRGVARLTARQPGWAAQVHDRTAPQLFWPEEHPRPLLKEFWASAS